MFCQDILVVTGGIVVTGATGVPGPRTRQRWRIGRDESISQCSS